MKKPNRQKRFQFSHDKDVQNEGAPNTKQEFREKLDPNRDEMLVHRIQITIEKENLLSAILNNIQVMANSGVITLEGIVFTQEEKNLVERGAAAIAGFNNINNNLEVIN